MDVRIIDNATRPAGDELIESLEWASQIRIATAFATGSGVSRLMGSFRRMLSKGGEIHVVYGLDFRITNPEAIEEFRGLANDYPGSVSHFAYSEWELALTQTFHPKLYICADAARNAQVLVGSSNLTVGGLWTNAEANVIVAGSVSEPVVADAYSIFNRIHSSPRLFVPDSDYIDHYRVLRENANAGRPVSNPPRHLAAAYKEIKTLEERLPGTKPTQRRVVIDAIKSLPADRDGFVHLEDIRREAERLARVAGAEFDWDTFGNSVRGRLNEHTVGKGGEELFERWGGVRGRRGLYRLTEAGDRYQGR